MKGAVLGGAFFYGVTMADTSWLSYSNQGATRSQPLNQRLVDAMSFLPSLGVSMNVYSGGQPSAGNGPRVGSIRHDHGNAGDVTFHQNGRMLDWNNPADLPTISNIVAQARAAGVTGIGAGNDYMGPGRFHVGFGTPSVWGAGGRSATAPEWLRTAYYGTPAPPRAISAPNAPTTLTPLSPGQAPAPRPGLIPSIVSGIGGLLGGQPPQAAAPPIMQGVAPAQPRLPIMSGPPVRQMPVGWAADFGNTPSRGGSGPRSLVGGSRGGYSANGLTKSRG